MNHVEYLNYSLSLQSNQIGRKLAEVQMLRRKLGDAETDLVFFVESCLGCIQSHIELNGGK